MRSLLPRLAIVALLAAILAAQAAAPAAAGPPPAQSVAAVQQQYPEGSSFWSQNSADTSCHYFVQGGQLYWDMCVVAIGGTSYAAAYTPQSQSPAFLYNTVLPAPDIYEMAIPVKGNWVWFRQHVNGGPIQTLYNVGGQWWWMTSAQYQAALVNLALPERRKLELQNQTNSPASQDAGVWLGIIGEHLHDAARAGALLP